MDLWTVWILPAGMDKWALLNATSEADAVQRKRVHLRGGARCAVIVSPAGRVTDCERGGEEVSLDEMLGRGRKGTATRPAPYAADGDIA